MLESILTGEAPSALFRRIIEADASISNIRLGEIVRDEFGGLSGLAQQIIWHWKGPGRGQGLSDENLDASLRELFVEAGYL
ncbi:hypothetical protein [Luteibacter aegosomatissinici]|uniref:hypothetical protein n=1 Tax=Luteibacter aegosomatissinici TaxID=2911539 RepID=UPI001FFAF094|nr:hypothetical protein [Luteibacter aegosomatissinici]UPG96480.1 hypothetical protein L2Y97_10305 [Luteibacter aegosomatissinici]